MDVRANVEEMRAWRQSVGTASVGFVPTMGALHDGHLSLVRAARERNDAVVASIFVNPKQFAEGEDFGTYPRTLEADVALLEREGVDCVFAPGDAASLYPAGFRTYVSPEGIDAVSEGAARPGFFRGVATVVAKLFNIVQPSRAYFGQKDGLQCIVIRRMVADLNMPLEVVVCPTSRESDGLAMSSRNVYLSAEQRRAAPDLFRALTAAQDAAERGGSAAEARAAAERVIGAQPLFERQYVSCADLETGEELPAGARACPVMLSAAVRVGATRLIDNVTVGSPPCE